MRFYEPSQIWAVSFPLQNKFVCFEKVELSETFIYLVHNYISFFKESFNFLLNKIYTSVMLLKDSLKDLIELKVLI